MRNYLTALCAAAAVSCGTAQGAAFKTLYSFCAQSDCADGQHPAAAIALDAHGNLFGTTVYGGTGVALPDHGIAFELSRVRGQGWTYHLLHVFCSQTNCTDGDFPQGGVIVDTAGNIYGTANGGGASDDGTIFELSRGSGFAFVKLYDFSGPDGATPAGGLRYAGYESGAAWDATSPLYGITAAGGANQAGSAFQLMPGPTWTLSTLTGFGGNLTGRDPWMPITVAPPGNALYGTTYNIDTVYELTNSGGGGWAGSTIYTFSKTTGDHSYFPYGGVVQAASGALIGTANEGGPSCVEKKHHIDRCGGSLFSLTPGAPWTYTALHEFCSERHCKDGAGPSGSVLIDGGGNVYGTTQGGGSSGNGAIYRLLADGTFQVLHSFCRQPSCTDGEDPSGDLVMDAKGRLYGTTDGGGTNNGGTVFELTP